MPVQLLDLPAQLNQRESHMITLQDLAKQKHKVHIAPSLLQRNRAYDHHLQQAWRDLDKDTFKISVKSDTMFDGEKDKGDEH